MIINKCIQDKKGNPKVIQVEIPDEPVIDIFPYNYKLRIIAPKTLALQYPAIYVWFQLNGLPVEPNGDSVYLYCNEILPEHQALINSLTGLISVETNPNING